MNESRGAELPTVHGSEYDRLHGRRASRRPLRRLRGFFSWHLIGLFAAVWPWIYLAYCTLVWRSGRVRNRWHDLIRHGRDHHGGVVGALWHQEVFSVAYAYRAMRPHTLASVGNQGRVITRMLERCGFVVFRGGSSGARTRRRRVLFEMIRHMRENPGVVYGITVDGSRGPALQVKPGVVLIAKACRTPIYLVRTWTSRYLTLPTWDRTVVPLPGGRIVTRALGPYWIAPDASPEEVKACRAHVESELLELAYLTALEVGDLEPGALPVNFPPDWRSRWVPGSPGLRRTPWDLRPESPPPWARRADGDDRRWS
ncbi:MAG: DUF374 domain-containing protein [Planctomycetota bacterium]|nr:MAG: DUF374 domain-containing protein [Planctomycetota bacterium]